MYFFDELKMKTKIIFLTLFTIFFCSILNVSAWVEPSDTSNIVAPLNTGATAQSKAGGLILNTGGTANPLLIPSGSVGIGTTTPRNDIGWPAALDVNGQVRGTRFYDDDVNYYADLNSGANLGGNWNFNGNVCIGGECRQNWCPVGYFSVFKQEGQHGDYTCMQKNASASCNNFFNECYDSESSAWYTCNQNISWGPWYNYGEAKYINGEKYTRAYGTYYNYGGCDTGYVKGNHAECTFNPYGWRGYGSCFYIKVVSDWTPDPGGVRIELWYVNNGCYGTYPIGRCTNNF